MHNYIQYINHEYIYRWSVLRGRDGDDHLVHVHPDVHLGLGGGAPRRLVAHSETSRRRVVKVVGVGRGGVVRVVGVGCGRVGGVGGGHFLAGRLQRGRDGGNGARDGLTVGNVPKLDAAVRPTNADSAHVRRYCHRRRRRRCVLEEGGRGRGRGGEVVLRDVLFAGGCDGGSHGRRRRSAKVLRQRLLHRHRQAALRQGGRGLARGLRNVVQLLELARAIKLQ